MTPIKRCSRCGRTLPLDAFHRDPTKRDGRVSRCGECLSGVRRARRRQTAAQSRQRDREGLAADPTARRALRRHRGAVAALAPALDPEAAERVERIVAMADAALKRRL